MLDAAFFAFMVAVLLGSVVIGVGAKLLIGWMIYHNIQKAMFGLPGYNLPPQRLPLWSRREAAAFTGASARP